MECSHVVNLNFCHPENGQRPRVMWSPTNTNSSSKPFSQLNFPVIFRTPDRTNRVTESRPKLNYRPVIPLLNNQQIHAFVTMDAAILL